MKQIINILGYWTVIIFYDLKNFGAVADTLEDVGCPEDLIEDIYESTSEYYNTGFTFTNEHKKLCVVGISTATSGRLALNTIMHEAKHVQSSICEYYNVSLKGEAASYLLGYLATEMYDNILKLLNQYE